MAAGEDVRQAAPPERKSVPLARQGLFLGAQSIGEPGFGAAGLERLPLAVVGGSAGGGEDFEGCAHAPVGIGETLADKLLIYDAMEMKFRKLSRPKDPDCPLCGNHPTISDLGGDYQVTCAI